MVDQLFRSSRFPGGEYHPETRNRVLRACLHSDAVGHKAYHKISLSSSSFALAAGPATWQKDVLDSMLSCGRLPCGTSRVRGTWSDDGLRMHDQLRRAAASDRF